MLRPLQQLTELCQGPGRLCQKRQDKLMDFTAAAARLRQNKDGAKKQQVRRPITLNNKAYFIENSAAQYEDEVAAARTTYSALNCQLVAELPQLIQLAGGVLGQAVHQLAVARKLYVGNCTRELLAVMEVSNNASVQPFRGVLVSVVCKVCLSLANLTDHKSY